MIWVITDRQELTLYKRGSLAVTAIVVTDDDDTDYLTFIRDVFEPSPPGERSQCGVIWTADQDWPFKWYFTVFKEGS